MEEPLLSFVVGTIGLVAVVCSMYISYEFFFIKERDPVFIIEEPMFMSTGFFMFTVIFVRMWYSGAVGLGLIEPKRKIQKVDK